MPGIAQPKPGYGIVFPAITVAPILIRQLPRFKLALFSSFEAPELLLTTDVDPKLEKGGCFTAHNVSNRYGGTKEFLDYVKNLPNYKTTIDRSSSSGVSISYKGK